MKLKITFTLVTLFLLFANITTATPAPALAPADDPTAFGAGQFTFLHPSRMRHEQYAFSFDATVNKHGKGKGRAEFDNLTVQTHVEIKIDCVNIHPDGEAAMSGRVQHSDDPDFPKGSVVTFGALDGAQFPLPNFPDQITPIFIFPPEFGCGVSPLTILPLDSGEIVVQP